MVTHSLLEAQACCGLTHKLPCDPECQVPTHIEYWQSPSSQHKPAQPGVGGRGQRDLPHLWRLPQRAGVGQGDGFRATVKDPHFADIKQPGLEGHGSEVLPGCPGKVVPNHLAKTHLSF